MNIRIVTLVIAILCLFGGLASRAGAANDAALFATSFGDDIDANYDEWPDRWQRTTGLLYPHYSKIGITSAADTDDGRCLQIELDGGGAQLSSPPIGILAKFGYELRLKVKTEDLHHTRVTIAVDLLNRDGERLQFQSSPPMGDTDGWVEVLIGPFRPQSDAIDRAIIRIDAPRGKRGDLKGRVQIDEITLERLPSMTVTTGRVCNVYDNLDEVEVHCALSGIRDQNPEIRFQLLDATSQKIEGKSFEERIEGELIVEDKFSADDIVGAIGNRTNGYEGSTVWRPKIDEYGFYKIRVEMLKENTAGSTLEQTDYDRQLQEQVITLAVLPPLPRPAQGEFGWTLPVADQPLSFESLAELLPRVGVHWAKMPVWYAADDPARGEEFVRFAERASASQIEVVGIIDDPTIEGYKFRDPSAPSDVANLLLADPSYWRPHLDHVMMRLSLRLRWWQLGNDLDTSFYGYPNLPEKLLAIRQSLYRFGQDVKLGLGWRWPAEEDRDPWSPPESNPSWEFEQMSASSALTGAKLEAQMAAAARTPASRWVLVGPHAVTPLDAADSQSPETEALRHQDRIRAFVRQMVAAKIHGADGIFVANPFTGPKGVMSTDGTPGELLLPWRTTAHLLSGSHYLGDLQLPGGSTNHVFEQSNGKLVMIVWNDSETTEQLYLGESVDQLDVWGKRQHLERVDGQRVALQVGRLPSFVLGMSSAVTRWRMAITFDEDRIPSVFSRAHENGVRGVNYFSQGVSGQFSIYVPEKSGEESRSSNGNERWEILPSEGELTIGSRQPFDLPIQIALDEATYGVQPVRIDFRIDADRQYQFSVWRRLRVGLGDVSFSVTTHLDELGQLIVEQSMTNIGSRPSDFKCLLYAPPRRRKRTQVVMLGPEGNTKIYQYPNGEELIGQVLKLRAEEMAGNRVLIHRFTAERGNAAELSTEASSATTELPGQ
ncbi:MAG: hypothetical protein ACR2NU_04250 [Aeoliella sp.]